ncbi:DNA polymerase I [Clostridium argentinense CDC 2741]|uniref:DNA polymerase I n=1 Tax=Clostridium argentinense CDC 2741 TaxID=1418104 RepID=A0A0C1U8P8_9CLOT|nr:DNA polymerase I [Clostridium argentinense]ARC85091.1 DNA polymerase I [Clostridium argentinense]KIE48088.1 DNA polymerase I [Clostridium argentinense CDC 2741]NFF39614.1 DNA polymerase I [Clostridium argentinense]NFP51281.1 DNA polymerase I [Clostridium argentinense]NFP72801.1 DNA polymerase I [Clostridium argentinense]
MSKERLLILDGNSLLYRAFYAMPALTNSEGIYTNAVYGFTNMLFKMIEDIEPDYIVTAFDRAAPTFRHVEYDEYKAGRKKMPDELGMQFPIVKDLLQKMAINIFEIDGYEADDLIGTLSVFAEKNNIEVYIVTGDKDALQLATDNVKIVINKKGMTEKEVYDKNRMIEEFGVTPKQFIDVKGLMGDKSDNIPGVPGVGEKTAFKLIKEYGSIENLLQNLENVSGKKLKENLIENSEQAIFSKKLATIITDVPVDMDLESIKSKKEYDNKGLKELFHKLQFKSLLSKIDNMNGQDNIEEKVVINMEYTTIEDLTKLTELINDIKETVFLTFKLKDVNVYSKLEIEYIFIIHNSKYYIINISELMNKDSNETIKVLKALFENEEIKKVSHGLKNVYTALNKLNIDLKSVEFDSEIAAYLIDSSKSEYTLKTLIEDFINETVSGENLELEINSLAMLPKVYEEEKKIIEELNMNDLLYEIEQPLTKAISIMECAGFKIHREKLDELGENFKEEIDSTSKSIYEMSDEIFNINSPKQLGKILFEKLDLPVIKKTKTGYSTNAEVLEALKDKHPIIEKIIYYRQLTKLYSTYIEGLKAVIDTDGKIHSSFNQTVTTTGRLSSTEPNLQNIPIKYEMGRAIRKVFIPENENSLILSADYSQIELRVLAHISQDENLINAFKKHSDIHTITASEVFGVPIDEVTSTMRGNAKAVNFGIVYGIGDFSLAQDLNITKAEAKKYIDNYLERYPKVKEYMDNVINEAENKQYVTTILNRRRFIPEISASNKILKALGKRLAMNAPIQGSAADIIKLAMVNVYEELTKRSLKSKLILQVHDELILNVYKDELDEVTTLVKKEMEEVLDLSVPLEVDINIGETWYEAK